MPHTNELYRLVTKLMHKQNEAGKDLEEADEESGSLDSQIKTINIESKRSSQ